MSGHLLSIDGLVMWRQGLALIYHHSWSLVPPIWWGGSLTSSYRGVGASLQYVPSLLAFSWLAGHVPVQAGPQYDFRLLYSDLLYTVAGAPVWVAITAVTAYVVALTARVIGGDTRAALWAVAFFGLGSPALAASRGDWPQPLVGMSWALAMYGALKFGEGGRARWLWLSAVALVYGVLTRPLEGSLILPAVLLVVWKREPGLSGAGVGQGVAWALAVGATLALNWVRFGAPLNFGYSGAAVSWSTPIWVGLPGALVSPGRGLLWEFPALALTALGTWVLWRRGRRAEAVALAGAPLVLLIEACQYFDWVGGWDWGFRFFVPALPLVSSVAGVGVLALGVRARTWLPAVLLAGGVVWNLPVIATDLLAGYGSTYADAASNWRLDAYPPIGAWRFLKEVFPTSSSGGGPVDIVWFRAVRVVGKAALIPFVALIAGSISLWIAAARQVGNPKPAC